jgi:hypothetical protein
MPVLNIWQAPGTTVTVCVQVAVNPQQPVASQVRE